MNLNPNEIEERGRKFALQVTAAFFLFLLVLCLAIRIKPKEKYQELAIRLDNVPVVKDKAATTKKPEPVKTEKKAQEKQVKQEKKTEDKAESKSKPSPKKAEKSPEPAKKKAVAENKKEKFEEPKLKKSVDELMAENNSSKKKKVEFDESLFADSPDPVQTKETSRPNKAAVAKSSLSGSSASSDTRKASGSSASSSSSNAADNSVSDSTRDALSDIKNVNYSSTVAKGIKSKASVNVSRSSNGAVSMQMSDGSARTLLYPKSPAIYISEENAKLVDATKNVKISFVVKSDGSVPFSEIQITPGSAIPGPIQQEIKDQIKDWKFSEDLSGKSARAVFNYSLEIK